MSRAVALKQLGELIEEIRQDAISRGVAVEDDEITEGMEEWKDGRMEGKRTLSA